MEGYVNCVNVEGYLDCRMPLNRVLVAALAVQVPDRILRAQGPSPKQKTCCGKTCYIVQSAVHLVPVRQTWKVLRLTRVWKKNIETTLFTRLVYSVGFRGATVWAPFKRMYKFCKVKKNFHCIQMILQFFSFYMSCGLASLEYEISVFALWACLLSSLQPLPSFVRRVVLLAQGSFSHSAPLLHHQIAGRLGLNSACMVRSQIHAHEYQMYVTELCIHIVR